MRNILAREGYFIETRDGLIFDVKGCIHPQDKIIAYLRYYPDSFGERSKKNIKYKKVYSINERNTILSEKHEEYLVNDPIFDSIIQEVPIKDIIKIHNPIEFRNKLKNMENLTELQRNALDFTNQLIQKIDLNESMFGITGSPMVSLDKNDSDIDIIIYGSKTIKKARKGLKKLFNNKNEIKKYTIDELKELYKFKCQDTKISWNDFIKLETRKIFQGKFRGIDFYIRGVKDWNEINVCYGDFSIKNLGTATIKGIIQNNIDSIFTPCIYKIKESEIIESKIKDIPINEIFSYRGRFCELLNKNENFITHGTIEQIIPRTNKSYYRIIIGGNKEDFLKLI